MTGVTSSVNNSSITTSSGGEPSVSATSLSSLHTVQRSSAEGINLSLTTNSISGPRRPCISSQTKTGAYASTSANVTICPAPPKTISLARLVPTSTLASLPLDFSKHVVRLPDGTSALLNSALNKSNYEMSGVDTLATVAAALDPRESPASLPPPPPYTSACTNTIAGTSSMTTVDSTGNNLPVLAKSADGYVMKLVDSRSLKLVSQGGPVYVNVPNDKLLKTQLSGDYHVVRPVVNQTIKHLYPQGCPPPPKSPTSQGSPVRSTSQSSAAPPQRTPLGHMSPKPLEEPVLSFQVLKAGDKHAHRPVSEPPRYITQLTQNLQQQQLQQQLQLKLQQQQHNMSSGLEAAYVMRSLPSQTVHINDHQRASTVLPGGYKAQVVIPTGRNEVEYHVLSPEQMQKMDIVKTEYPTKQGKSDYAVRTVTGGHLPHAYVMSGHAASQVDSKANVRSLDVQTMKVVDTLAPSVQPSNRQVDYTTTTTIVNSHGSEAPHHPHRSHQLNPAPAVQRSLSADGLRKPVDRAVYSRVLSVDTVLTAHSAPSLDSSSSYPVRMCSRTASEQSLHMDERMQDTELKNLVNDSDKTHWGVVFFNAWLTSHEFRGSPSRLDSVCLASLLTLFYSDLKSELSPEHLNLASLLDMRDAVDQYFRSRGHPCSIVTDIRFGLANQAFDSVIAARDAENKLVSLGIAKQSVVTDKKQDSAFRANPRDLLTRIWIDMKLHLKGFNVDQLRQMKKTDFLISACDDGRLVVNQVVRNWQDIIKVPTKTGTEYKCIPFMYQNKDNPAICPVLTFLEYSSRLCPSGVEFLQHPLLNYKYAGGIWYSCEKGTPCTIHHRHESRTPPLSGRSTPSTTSATTPIRHLSSTGKAVHPSASPVRSPRPASTYSDSLHSDFGGDRHRADEDGSFSPLPDISSILKQPPPLAQLHDNIYHTPVSTPVFNHTPTLAPTTTKPKKKKVPTATLR